jgi:hypothetical protein
MFGKDEIGLPAPGKSKFSYARPLRNESERFLAAQSISGKSPAI